jgi:hypothetical protein
LRGGFFSLIPPDGKFQPSDVTVGSNGGQKFTPSSHSIETCTGGVPFRNFLTGVAYHRIMQRASSLLIPISSVAQQPQNGLPFVG